MLKYKIPKRLILMFINYIVIAFLLPQGVLAQDSSRMDASDRLSWQQAYAYGSGWVINSTIHDASYNMAVDNVETRNALEKKLIQKRLQGSGKSIDIKGPKAAGGKDPEATGDRIDLNDFKAISDLIMNGAFSPGTDPEQIRLARIRYDFIVNLFGNIGGQLYFESSPELYEKYSFFDFDNDRDVDYSDFNIIWDLSYIEGQGPASSTSPTLTVYENSRRQFLDAIYTLATMDNQPYIKILDLSDKAYSSKTSYDSPLAFASNLYRTGPLGMFFFDSQDDDPLFGEMDKQSGYAGANTNGTESNIKLRAFSLENGKAKPPLKTDTPKAKTSHMEKDISSLKTPISDKKSLEDIIEHLENKENKTDFDEALLEIAKALIKDTGYVDKSTSGEFDEVLHLIHIAAAIQEFLPEANFGAITNIFSDFTIGHESSYNNYLISTEKIYQELEKILGIDLESALLPDKYKRLNTLGPKTKRKILVDLTLKNLSDKNKENLSNSEKKALSIYQDKLLVLARGYRDTLKKSVDKLILSLNKALANVKPASLAEDKEQFKVLFSLGR